jgi:hypothetical protein
MGLIDSLWVGGVEQRKKSQLMFCVSATILATFRHYCLVFFLDPEPESNMELYEKDRAHMEQNMV